MNNFIPISKPSISDKEITYVNDAITSGWVSSLGPYIDRFEDAFANYCGVRYALTASNGTTALHLAMLSLGIGEGDEVIIPDLTFIASANAVSYVGAKPVPVDIDRFTLCISPESIIKAITPKTRAIMPVHLYGHPADMIKISEIAEKYNLSIIEDAAEAHGAMLNGRKVGSFGDCGVFSFYGNKIITTGEGGIITTDNKNIYIKAKHLRDHAMSTSKRYWHEQIGYNYRLTNIQAALGLAQLERIESFIEKRIEIMGWYKEFLEDLPSIRLNYSADNVRNVFWMVCIEIEGMTESLRDKFMIDLRSRGIDSRPYFYPVSDMPMYTEGIEKTEVTHNLYALGLNLPSFFDLTKAEVSYVCAQVRELLT